MTTTDDSTKSDLDHGLVLRATPESVERFERWEAPTPGTYWRLEKPFDGDHDDEAQIRGNAVAEGTVLLLTDIEHADGAPHVYVFAPHPSVERSRRFPLRVHVDVFHDWFAIAPDGEAIRTRELAELQRSMADTQARMLRPPPEAVPVAALSFDPGAGDGATGSALATRDSIAEMARYAEAVEAGAKAMTAWIEENNQVLGEQASALARFHSERAEASLARARQQLDGVKGLLKTVANLHLYVGDGIEVAAVCDGPPAPPDAPLTIYQELLALDEELAIHLEEGGIDHRHVGELAQALSDPAVVDRMIPAPRGVVLVRFRARSKTFFVGHDMASVMADKAANDEAKRKRLLLRDGARVWLINLPDQLQGIEQLLPNAAEQLGHFTTEEGTRIRREHLGYAAAQRRQLGNLDAYAQALIILWGLYDRGEVMDGWALPRFTNWLDPGVQASHMTLCDQSTMLGEEREDYAAFRRRHNQYLGSGATVAVRVPELFRQERIPGAYASQSRWTGRGHEYTQLYEWDRPEGATVHIGRVRSDTRGLHVELPLVKDDGSGARRTGKLYLSSRDAEILVLDRVHGPDLTYFLTSRAQRRGYADYLLLFQGARAWVDARDAEEAPLRQALAVAAGDARLDTAPERLEPAITSALAVARTARRDKAIPAPGTPAHRTYLRAALDTLHSLLTDQEERIGRVERWAARTGRQPLRLALAGGQQWRLYLAPLAAEHDPLLGEPTHVTVATVDWTGPDLEAAVVGRDTLQSRADEQMIREWDAAAAWQRKTSPFHPLSYQDATSVLDTVRNWSIDAPSPEDAFAEAIVYMDADRTKNVGRMEIGLPVGMVLSETGNPWVLFAQIDALGYAYAQGDQALRDRVIALVERRYMHPQGHVERLRELAHTWRAGAAPLAEARALLKRGYARDYLQVVRKEFIRRPGSGEKAPPGAGVRITGLTARGAELLPWMKELTEGPM